MKYLPNKRLNLITGDVNQHNTVKWWVAQLEGNTIPIGCCDQKFINLMECDSCLLYQFFLDYPGVTTCTNARNNTTFLNVFYKFLKERLNK
jgi:hypothetical protein